jgi:hypothetical protein
MGKPDPMPQIKSRASTGCKLSIIIRLIKLWTQPRRFEPVILIFAIVDKSIFQLVKKYFIWSRKRFRK